MKNIDIKIQNEAPFYLFSQQNITHLTKGWYNVASILYGGEIMSRDKFYLFVDEVKPTGSFKIYNFTGIVIKANEYENIFKNSFNTVKEASIARLGGAGCNLHFTYDEQKLLWSGLGKIFEETDFHILAGIVHADNHNKYYPHYKVKLENLAFKILIQSFVRYLHLQNGHGEIIVESSNDDEKLREDFYISKFTGSNYITHDGYNSVLRGIKFETKDRLIEGLQLADFMANPISRLVSEMKQYEIHKFYSKEYDKILHQKIFDGGISNPYEFGVRKIFM